jgi:hypothetical protein
MKVLVSDLRHIANALFDQLEAAGQHEFNIEDDYYWTISAEQRYDPTKAPTDFELEQLTDNWRWLNRIQTRAAEPIAYHLVWLAAFLRWIGEKVVR